MVFTRSKLHIRIAALLALLMLFGSVITYSGTPSEAGYPEIRSMAQMYSCLVDQINAREVTRYYTVKDQALRDQLIHLDLDQFATHVNQEDPLNSGCYLVYYLSTVYLSYRGSQFKVVIRYPYSKEEMDSHFQKMKSLATQLKGATDFDTIKNVHDYLIDNFEYDQKTTMVNHTDIDGFRDGVMVCSGYSLAAYYLLNVAGVPTRVITGYGGPDNGDETNHMWNMVQLDGKWYNLDVTWDDGGGTSKYYDYFLKSDADFPDHRRMGVYSNESFRLDVAEDSYPLPFHMELKKPLIILIAVFVGTILVIIILSKRKKRNAYYGSVVVEDDPFDGAYERDYESWKNGGNGYV